MAKVLVFDVNETLLDLAALRGPFARAFGDTAPMSEWFVRLLHGSLVSAVTDNGGQQLGLGAFTVGVRVRSGQAVGRRPRRPHASRDP
jgi:hypothetical protein